ncbi:MAG: class I SAM-dependent methyltransferase [Stellaceae bacterium]
MSDAKKPRTTEVHARLWGARARDWADYQEGQVRALYETVLARSGLKPGMAYLDAGCGSGLAAQIAVSRGARVSGIDAAGELLAIARERSPKGDFRAGDLEELPYADKSFDIVTGFNSFQFAGNPALALGEARRVTKPGGIVAIVTWGKPEGMEMASIITSLKELMPPPPPGSPGPFALSDETALRAFAVSGGLKPGEVFDIPCILDYPDLATALRGLNSSGVAARAMENSSEQAVSAAHTKALAPFRQKDGHYKTKAMFRCLLARP